MKGLEPSTFCMASRRSSQLSYIRGTAEYRSVARPARGLRTGVAGRQARPPDLAGSRVWLREPLCDRQPPPGGEPDFGGACHPGTCGPAWARENSPGSIGRPTPVNPLVGLGESESLREDRALYADDLAMAADVNGLVPGVVGAAGAPPISLAGARTAKTVNLRRI
jgi:hypothetical protein